MFQISGQKIDRTQFCGKKRPESQHPCCYIWPFLGSEKIWPRVRQKIADQPTAQPKKKTAPSVLCFGPLPTAGGVPVFVERLPTGHLFEPNAPQPQQGNSWCGRIQTIVSLNFFVLSYRTFQQILKCHKWQAWSKTMNIKALLDFLVILSLHISQQERCTFGLPGHTDDDVFMDRTYKKIDNNQSSNNLLVGGFNPFEKY